MADKQYNPANVQFIFGAAPVSGFADGSFIDWEQEENTFTESVGADGEVTRIRNHNANLSTFTIKLMQTSMFNDVLSALHTLDRGADGGAGVVPVLLRQNDGTHLIASDKAWVMNYAKVTFAKGAEAREWKIRVSGAIVHVGGNP